jgi:hypothetical protein
VVINPFSMAKEFVVMSAGQCCLLNPKSLKNWSGIHDV